jgi:hypothetical protein
MSDQTVEQQLAEALAENARLRALLPPDLDPDLVARAGRCQPCNLYIGMPGDPDGYLLGKLPTPEWAAHVIHALNAFDWDGQVGEGRKVLDVPMQPNDPGAPTIRAYLVELARIGFQEKRPFGNSGWQHELWEALGAAGLMSYTRGEPVDLDKGYELIATAMAELAVAR